MSSSGKHIPRNHWPASHVLRSAAGELGLAVSKDGIMLLTKSNGRSPVEVRCAFCSGNGRDPFGIMSWRSSCCVCLGRGSVIIDTPHERCAHCNGTGAVKTFSCTVCRGKGVVPTIECLTTTISSLSDNYPLAVTSQHAFSPKTPFTPRLRAFWAKKHAFQSASYVN